MYSKKEVKQSLIYNLTAEEINNPYLLIEQFFDLTSLSDHLDFLHQWKEKVLTDQYYAVDNWPENLIYMHQHIQKLVEAAWLLRKKSKVFWPSNTVKLQLAKGVLAKEREKNGEAICYLTDEELLNPYSIFRLLFKTYDLGNYRLHLRNWLSEALSRSFLSYSEVITIYKNLQKLYQACWLILQRDSPNLLPEINIKIDQ